MKRNVGDILRLGFESMVANWPLLIIRIVESVVLVVMIIIAVVAMLVPLAVSFGADHSLPVEDESDAAAIVLGIVATHAAAILWMLVMLLVVITVALMVHSFVIAGSAGVYVASIRQTAAIPVATRDQMNAFTTERWLASAKASWWSVFWIYNVAWGVAFLILIIPFVIVIPAVIMLRANGPAAVITGCAGAFLIFVLVVPVVIVTAIWTEKAIVDACARRSTAMDSLRAAWREFRADLGRHLGVAAIMFVVTLGAGMVAASFSSMASFGHQPSLAMIPLQFTSSIIESVVSAAVGAWFLACFSALAVEQP